MPGMASIGLVLGAGGLAGHAYHVGVLGALEAALDWDARDVTVIVGTSAGAGVGSLLRAGLSIADLRARIDRRPMSPNARTLAEGMPADQLLPPYEPRMGRPASPSLLLADLRRPWRFRLGHVIAAAAPAGRASADAIRARHDHLHRGARWPEQPLWINALRLRDGAHAVFGRDASPEPTVGAAVAASCAIPGYFAPVEIDGERYVDGGAHSPTNAHLLARLGLDLVVVSSPMSARPGPGMLGATGFSGRLVGRPYHHLRLTQELQAYRRSATRLKVFEPTPADQRAMGLNPMEAGPMAAIAASAEASATAALTRDKHQLLTVIASPVSVSVKS